MTNTDVKKIIETNVSLTNDIEKYVDEYVQWVEKNVPEGMEGNFGVGICSRNRHGVYWGYDSGETDIWGEPEYVQTGKDWYVGNDFNCLVKGSTKRQAKEFARSIPKWLTDGLKSLEKEKKDLEQLKTELCKLSI